LRDPSEVDLVSQLKAAAEAQEGGPLVELGSLEKAVEREGEQSVLRKFRKISTT